MLSLKKNSVILSAILFFLSFPFPTYAQSNSRLDLTASPSFFDLAGNPESTISAILKIHNNTNQNADLKIALQSFQTNSDNSLKITDLEENDEFASWINFEKSEFTAPANEWVDIAFTVSPPKTAAFGYYYAIVIQPLDSIKVNNPNSTSTLLTGKLAVPLLINIISPGARAEGSLLNFSTTKKFYEYLPAEFNIEIKNQGNVHIAPRGNIFIHSQTKKNIAILEVNQEKGNILPQSNRSFTTKWTDGFITRDPIIENGAVKLDNKGKPKTKLNFHPDHLSSFRVGHYTANLITAFDGGNKDVVLEGSTSFWVIPYKILIILFLIFSILLYGAVSIIKSLSTIIKSAINKNKTLQ